MTMTDRRDVGVSEFAALCNLFCAIHCGDVDPTPEQAGDILLYRAYPMVCDHSRTVARAVLAFLGIETGHMAGDELIREVRAAMRNGEGSLPDGDNTP